MTVTLETSSPTTTIRLWHDGNCIDHDTWLAGRSLAKDLLAHIDEMVGKHDGWDRLTGVGVYRGPGSFTGLRIGITTANTIAHAQGVAIIGETGDAWEEKSLQRLRAGETDRIVIPEYGAEPHITSAKK